MYSPQNISNAKNFNPHKKPISLLNVPICTQGMQRTWWPEAGTIIVTGPYHISKFGCVCVRVVPQGRDAWRAGAQGSLVAAKPIEWDTDNTLISEKI